eukprot:1082089-Prymnesium_polylepis.2
MRAQISSLFCLYALVEARRGERGDRFHPCDASPPDVGRCAVSASNKCVGCARPSGANVPIGKIDHLSETGFASLRAANWPLPPPGVFWRENYHTGYEMGAFELT